MRNCREISELVSESMDRPLSVQDRLETWLHLKICAGCRRFAQQLEIIRLGIARLCAESATDQNIADEASLSSAARERIRAAVRRD